MNIYSFPLFGAGITQLAECQLPKLNVAGSIPVTRSTILIVILLSFLSSPSVASFTEPRDFWLDASGFSFTSTDITDPAQSSERSLIVQLRNGNRKAFIPLVCLLVDLGRIDEAEIWMEGRGTLIPVTRRDLGIALSWYGRFSLYNIISSDLIIPPDLENDDYGLSLTTVLSAGWMITSPDGCFHPELLVNPSDLQRISDTFFPSSFHWQKNWIDIETLDSLFKLGPDQGSIR